MTRPFLTSLGALCLGCSGLLGPPEMRLTNDTMDLMLSDGSLPGPFELGMPIEQAARVGPLTFHKAPDGLSWTRGDILVDRDELVAWSRDGVVTGAKYEAWLEPDSINDRALKLFMDEVRTRAANTHPTSFWCDETYTGCYWMDLEAGVTHESYRVGGGSDGRWSHRWAVGPANPSLDIGPIVAAVGRWVRGTAGASSGCAGTWHAQRYRRVG